MPRFFCLWIPHFPAWAAMRSDPALRDRPLLVFAGGHIIAASPLALETGTPLGLRAGGERPWTVARVRSLLPDAVILPHHGPTTDWAWSQVLEALADLSPRVESVRPGLALADLRPPSLALPLVREWGACGGVADDRVTAEIAAFSTSSGTLRTVRPGESPAFLGRMPLALLEHLGVGEGTRERLGWFGWRFIGDLKALSPRQSKAQFPESAILNRCGGADDVRPVTLWQPPPSVAARFVWEEPVSEPGEIEPVLEMLLSQALAGLGDQATATVALGLSAKTGTLWHHKLLHQPTRDPRPLGMALRSLLGLLLPPEKTTFEAVELRLGCLRSGGVQGSLFEARRPPVEVAIRAVEARFPARLCRIVMVDRAAYLPETAFRLEPAAGFSQPPKPSPSKPKRRLPRVIPEVAKEAFGRESARLPL